MRLTVCVVSCLFIQNNQISRILEREDFEMGSSQSNTEGSSPSPFPEMVTSAEGAGMFEITAVASGASAVQYTDIESDLEPDLECKQTSEACDKQKDETDNKQEDEAKDNQQKETGDSQQDVVGSSQPDGDEEIEEVDSSIIEIEASPEEKAIPENRTRKSEPIGENGAMSGEQCVHEDNCPTPSTSPMDYCLTDDETDDEEDFTKELPLNDNDEILAYPRGAIKVEDYKSLDYRQMLNGNILDYWMFQIYEQKLTDEQRSRSHFYETTFFTTLAVDSNFSGWNTGENKHLRAEEKRYNRVKDMPCNQNVNVFEKDFIVIPCLEKEHWFLAIVCYPRLNGAFTLEDDSVPLKYTFSCNPANQKNEQRFPIRQSCILIFDSSQDIHGRGLGAIMKIKNFFKMTHLKQYKEEFDFNSASLYGIKNEVPQQINALDCGLFVLEFIECFFKNPPNDFRAPMRLGIWFDADKPKQKRAEISRNIIESLETIGSQKRLPPVTLFQK